MNRFRQVYNMILITWHVISDYQNRDITKDDVCKQMVDKLNDICRTYPESPERTFVSKISIAMLDYIFFKENSNDK